MQNDNTNTSKRSAVRTIIMTFLMILLAILIIWGILYAMGKGPGWSYDGRDIYIVKEGDDYFFVDAENQLAKKDKYDYIDVQSDGFFRICKDGKWGYLDGSLTIGIEPQYEECGNFQDGLAPVNDGDHWTYINFSNEIAIDDEFEWAGDFSDGKAVVQKDGSFEIIDGSGKVLAGPFYACDRLYENAFVVQKTAESSPLVLDQDLEEISLDEETSETAVSLYHGCLAVSYIEHNKKYAKLIDLDRSEILIDQKSSIAVTYDGNYFCFDGEAWTLLDQAMNIICEHRFDQVVANSQGFYPVCIEDLWGAVDSEGKLMIDPKYQSMGPFSSGFAPVQSEDGAWGIVDQTGEEIIPCSYEFAQYALCESTL